MSVLVSEVRSYLKAIEGYKRTSTEPQGYRFKDFLLAKQLLAYFQDRSDSDHLDESDVELLCEAFEARWVGKTARSKGIMHTPYSYTRIQSGQNQYFIELAILLGKKGVLGGLNYLQLLMPTLKSTFNAIEREDIAEIPEDPSELPLRQKTWVVSDNGEQLINVKQLVEYYRDHGAPVYFIEGPDVSGKELSQEEQYRFKETNKELWDSFESAQQSWSDKDNASITKHTLEAIKRLIIKSFNRKGVSHKTIPLDQYRRVKAAFLEFYNYVAFNLVEEERDALFKQLVYSPLNSKAYSVERVLTGAFLDERCLTLSTKDLCQLVVKYRDSEAFDAEEMFGENPELVQWINDHPKEVGRWLRVPRKEFSTRIPVQGYDLPEAVYKRRCLDLLVYIMSHQFKLNAGGGDIAEFNAIKNSVSSTAKEIQECIVKGLHAENFTKAYFELIENKVKPALTKNQSILGISLRAPDTQIWLESLSDHSFWQNRTSFFANEHLGENFLLFMLHVELEQHSQVEISKYREDILLLLLQRQGAQDEYNKLIIDIKMAIKANEFASKLNVDKKNAFLSFLEDNQLEQFASESDYEQFVQQQVVDKLVKALSLKVEQKSLIFSQVVMKEPIYRKLRVQLSHYSSLHTYTPKKAALKAFHYLLALEERNIDDIGLDKAKAYLRRLGFSEEDISVTARPLEVEMSSNPIAVPVRA